MAESRSHCDGSDGYERLRSLGERAILAGRFDLAVDHYAGALEAARQTADRALVDRALCNLTAVRIEHEGVEAVPTELREILVRNTNVETCRLAAYTLARAYELRKDHKKALFYARIARDHSMALGREDWMASSHNQIANCLVADSFFDEAIPEYEEALTLLGTVGAAPAWKAAAEGNLGYCFVVRGRFREGMPLLFRSLRVLSRTGSEREQMTARLDLCFAYLELGRPRHARRHGERALSLSTTLGDSEALKNSLYLLGEAANLLGDQEMAQGYFAKLQRHFPNTPFLVDFLLAIDVRKMINLRA